MRSMTDEGMMGVFWADRWSLYRLPLVPHPTASRPPSPSREKESFLFLLRWVIL